MMEFDFGLIVPALAILDPVFASQILEVLATLCLVVSSRHRHMRFGVCVYLVGVNVCLWWMGFRLKLFSFHGSVILSNMVLVFRWVYQVSIFY